MNNIDKLIVAHRGESFEAPENTIAAIELAWNLGAKNVEIDVHLTKDKQIVVIHDANTLRTTGFDGEIKNMTLSEIKELDAGSFKSQKYKGERIPTLEEVLNTIPFDGKLIIELKCGAEIIPYLKSEIYKSGFLNTQIEFISFNYKVISKLKKAMPRFIALWLLDLDYYWYTSILPVNKNRILKKLKLGNLDGIDVWAGKKANKSFLDFMKMHQFLVYLWTIDEPEVALKYKAWNADAITTNRASWLREKL